MTLAPGDSPMSRGSVPPELLRNTKLPKSMLEKLFGASRVAAPQPHFCHDPTLSATTAFTETKHYGKHRGGGRPGTTSSSSTASRRMNQAHWRDGRDPRLEHEKLRVESTSDANLVKLLGEGKKSRREKTKSANYTPVLPQAVFRHRWTEPVNRVKEAEERRRQEAAKQPKKARRPLTGANQWRESSKGSTYLKRLFVEGEIEKDRRHARFEERLDSFANQSFATTSTMMSSTAGQPPRGQLKGKLIVDLSASAKYSWRGDVDDPMEYRAMLYEEGVKSREAKGGRYYELIKDASRHLPGCLNLTKKKKSGDDERDDGGDDE